MVACRTVLTMRVPLGVRRTPKGRRILKTVRHAATTPC